MDNTLAQILTTLMESQQIIARLQQQLAEAQAQLNPKSQSQGGNSGS